MTDSLTYRRMGTAARGQAHTLFAQTMAYVAATAALFALGAWLGRNLTGAVGIIAFIAAFACLIGMRFAARSSHQLTVGLLAAFGLLVGLAVAPTIAYYGSMDPTALWQAGGATALFIAGFGAAGYATRRDLAPLARVLFWALVALIVFGIVLIFVNIPGGALVYSVLGLVIFAGFTMFDFQRIRTSTDINSAPFLAASIFLDILNVFLFFLQIFSGRQDAKRRRGRPARSGAPGRSGARSAADLPVMQERTTPGWPPPRRGPGPHGRARGPPGGSRPAAADVPAWQLACAVRRAQRRLDLRPGVPSGMARVKVVRNSGGPGGGAGTGSFGCGRAALTRSVRHPPRIEARTFSTAASWRRRGQVRHSPGAARPQPRALGRSSRPRPGCGCR